MASTSLCSAARLSAQFPAAALKPLPTPVVTQQKAITASTVAALPAGGATVALSTGTAATPTAVKSTKPVAVKAGDVKADDDTDAAAPATGSPVAGGKHRAHTGTGKKLGDNIKKALGGSDKKSEHATAGK